MTDKELRALVRQAAITVAAAIFSATESITDEMNEEVTDPTSVEDAVTWAAGVWDAAGNEPES